MTSVQDIKKAVMDFLTANVTDPISARSALSKNWIYDDFPRPDISSYPRIGIEAPAANLPLIGIGFTSTWVNAMLHIGVFVKRGQKQTIASVTYRDVELLDYIANQVATKIMDKANLSYWQGKGIIKIDPLSENLIENDTFIAKDLTMVFMARRG